MFDKRAVSTDSSSEAGRARARSDRGDSGNLLGATPRAGESQAEQWVKARRALQPGAGGVERSGEAAAFSGV